MAINRGINAIKRLINVINNNDDHWLKENDMNNKLKSLIDRCNHFINQHIQNKYKKIENAKQMLNYYGNLMANKCI